MKKSSFAFAVLALSVLAPATALAAEGTFTVEGTKVAIKSEKAGEKFVRFSYDVKSPRDVATGQASGKRQHAPICVAKASSQASPQLLQMLWMNDVVKSATFEVANGMRYKITNAAISSFTLTPDKDEEVICFTFQKIEVSFRGGQVISDDWMAK
jgi:type VI secretion system Hcp family effector